MISTYDYYVTFTCPAAYAHGHYDGLHGNDHDSDDWEDAESHYEAGYEAGAAERPAYTAEQLAALKAAGPEMAGVRLGSWLKTEGRDAHD